MHAKNDTMHGGTGIQYIYIKLTNKYKIRVAIKKD